MASTRDLKRKIKSVKSTQQITQAMNLVAAAKLQRARGSLYNTRPFFNETQRVISSVIRASKGVKHPFILGREVKRTAVIVITGDRGLCGGYNSNVSKEAYNMINSKKDVVLISVGNKGREFFSRRHKQELQIITGISEKPTYEDAAHIGKSITDLFIRETIDEAYIVYTTFKSTISHEPTIQKLLPLDPADFEAEDKTEKNSQGLMLYEPDEESVLDYIVPKYINTVIFGALIESSASEQGARMTAMDSATENASEIINSYSLLYNRARQGAITQEITEIVSGANALD